MNFQRRPFPPRRAPKYKLYTSIEDARAGEKQLGNICPGAGWIRFITSSGDVFDVMGELLYGSKVMQKMINDLEEYQVAQMQPSGTGSSASKLHSYRLRRSMQKDKIVHNDEPLRLSFETKEFENMLIALININETGRFAEDAVFTPYTLCGMLKLADYFDIKHLTTACTEAFNRQLSNKSPDDLRKMLFIRGDFRPEEEKQMKNEGLWTFNGGSASDDIEDKENQPTDPADTQSQPEEIDEYALP